MRGYLSNLRNQFFQEVRQLVPRFDGELIVLTHLLDDRPEFLEALHAIAPIALVIAIPYSTDPAVLAELKKHYRVAIPTLAELYDKDYLCDTVAGAVSKPSTIILEIGGYFAKALSQLRERLGEGLVGVVEDTETGFKAYQRTPDLPCPVISIARSQLKKPEDHLIGSSCLFSIEKILREIGFLVHGHQYLVIGFGKIGNGLARGLSYRGCQMAVFDIDPLARVNALSEGYRIPDKIQALKEAHVIFGATGNGAVQGDDFRHLRDGCLLVSCSSKDIEFDMTYLKKHYAKKSVAEHIDCYVGFGKKIYLAANGRPINFIDGACIGPVLALIQAEIIYSIKSLLELQYSPGLYETETENNKFLAEIWLKYFKDPAGCYAFDFEHHQQPKLKIAPQNEVHALD